MIATVTLYKNTGLTVGNCLDDSIRLESLGFTKVTFPDVAVKQDMMLESIRIAATFNDVKGADYCRINSQCYWITSINMLNDNVAELGLQPDFITTVGVTNLTIVSGWCKRRHVTNDTPFSNVLEEDFAPQNEPVLQRGTVITGYDPLQGEEDTPIIVSSINLLTISNAAKVYEDTASGMKCAVPQLPDTISHSQATKYSSNVVTPAKESDIALTAAYDLKSQTVQDGISALRSLGIESAISAAYVLPRAWGYGVKQSGSSRFSKIYDCHRTVDSQISPEYQVSGYTIKNKKTFTGQFNKVRLFSMASGDSIDFRVEDIIYNGVIKWKTYADCKYNGAPGCKPLYFQGAPVTDTLCSIKGAPWQNTPFIYTAASGALLDYKDAALQANKAQAEAIASLLDMSLSALGGLLGGNEAGMIEKINKKGEKVPVYREANFGLEPSAGTSAAGGVVNALLGVTYTKRQLRLGLRRKQIEAFGSMHFPETPYLADYISNAFYDTRSRLSDNDTIRFDKFLSMYGYAVDEPLTQECFTGRSHHNYVQAEDVALIKDNVPLMLLNGVAASLESGVRIWHSKPSYAYLVDNPILTPPQ